MTKPNLEWTPLHKAFMEELQKLLKSSGERIQKYMKDNNIPKSERLTGEWIEPDETIDIEANRYASTLYCPICKAACSVVCRVLDESSLDESFIQDPSKLKWIEHKTVRLPAYLLEPGNEDELEKVLLLL